MSGRFRMNFGPPSISRIYCVKCKEETLHGQWGVCAHCKTRHKQEWNSPPPKSITVGHREWLKASGSLRKQIEAATVKGQWTPLEIARKCRCSASLVWKIQKELRYREQTARKAPQGL